MTSLSICAAHHTLGHQARPSLTGFVIFLFESIIFLAFLQGFPVRLTSPEWLPAGVDGLEVKMPLINTIVLVSSGFVAFAERHLHKGTLGFRIVWFITMLMGAYFVYGIRRMVELEVCSR